MSRAGAWAWLVAAVLAGCGGRMPAGGEPPDPEPQEVPDPKPPAPRCGPTAGGPYWIAEGETVRATVTCASGLSLPGSAFGLPSLPRGAHYDPSSGTLEWRPGLDQAAVYSIPLTAEGESGTLKIGVADRFDDPRNVPVTDRLAYSEEYGLPVFFVDAPRTPSHDFYSPATVTYRGHVYQAQIRLRGAASLAFPKNSYNLKFDKLDPFREPEKAGGMVRNKIVLVTTFSDNSYVRQRFSYDLWNLLDASHFKIKTYSAVVFLNGEYWGLYVVTDHVSKDSLRINRWSQASNLYKPFSNDANFTLNDRFGDPKVSMHQGYEKKEGLPPEGSPGAFDDLDAFVDFVATASPADFAARFPTMANQAEFEDWWMLDATVQASDSTQKNYYLAHDPNGGLWRWIPWSFRASLGQDYQTMRDSPTSPWLYSNSNGLFSQLTSNPAITPKLNQRFHDRLRNEWALPVAEALLEGYFREITPCARRDQKVWGAAYRNYSEWNMRTDFNDFDGEAQYVRDWVRRRWTYLQGRF